MNILKNKWLWINLILGMLFFIGVFFMSFTYLGWLTKHGESITVPDLNNMQIEEVERLLENRNLRYRIIDSVFVADLRPNQVINQTPSAGSNVKENRRIYLTIRAVNPPLRKVPDLEGKSLNSAMRLLQNNGFKVGNTIYRPYRFMNTVLEVMHEGKKLELNEELPLGSQIDLVVSSGPGESVVSVPNLEGKTLEEAEFILMGGYNLNIGFIRYHENVQTAADSANAVIYRQNPEATMNNRLRWGESVDLFLMQRNDFNILNSNDTLPYFDDEE